MCNRARYDGEPSTLFGSAKELFQERPRDNRFNPQELRPRGRAYDPAKTAVRGPIFPTRI